MRKWIALLATLGCVLFACAQNTIGIPNIVNYSKLAYQAGSQNWNIAQDKTGILYFANNDGLLSFDGSFWRLYPLPNKTIARSLAIDSTGRIYIGGQGEIGYFAPGANGELLYTSLNKLLTAKDNDFADVWNICFFNKHVFFRSNRKILDYYQNRITAHNSPNWGFLSSVSGELLAIEYTNGLVSYRDGEWVPRIRHGQLPKENFMLRTGLPFGKDSTLLVSLRHGLFILHHDTIAAFETPAVKAIGSRDIAAACLVSPDRIALLTNLGGCNIISKQGEFIQRFTKLEGIQSNNVLSALLDKDKNLWLGLDNGIELVAYSNAIRSIFPDPDDRNSGYTSLIYNHQLYLGVSTGVYHIPLGNTTGDISYTNGRFEFVDDSKGQVWNLSEVNGKLLMGHNKGGYIIDNNKAIAIDTRTGFWAFRPLVASNPSPVMMGGTYEGLDFFNFANGIITGPVTHTNFESARFVGMAKDIIWVAHPYKGIYSITFKNGQPVATMYKDNKNILSSNHNKIFQLKDRIILTTDKGVFEYEEAQKDFVKATWFEKIAGPAPVSYIKEDQRGNIWFCRNRKVSVIDRSSGEPKVIFIPEVDDRIMASGFENINVIDSNNVLIAAEKGFFHINYAQYRKNKQPLQALIRKVQSPGREEIVYGGYGVQKQVPEINYKYNAFHFECSSTLYGQEQNTEFSYYLEGFDKEWSAWSRKKEKDYTNLPAGRYTFKVKCRNNFDNESPVAAYQFTILPPWYQTWWAYTLFVLAFVLAMYLFYKRQQRKYRRQQYEQLQEQQRKYAEEQKQLQLQHQLEIQESEKQIIELRNEKLQSEVEHKNTELASSAMNLVRKKEILSRLKEDLAQYKQMPEADKKAKEFQKIVRVIDKELDHNEEWEQFAVHFDSVHTNYLKKLKDGFADLTPSDLKLAAYLRLNLSTKEIAQLMNISIRGVETSRYRLRKKLNLANETSLYDFLIKVTS